MKTLTMITYLFVILGSVSLGLVGLFDVNLITVIFGSSEVLTNLVYFLIGVSGLYSVKHLGTVIK